MTLDDQQPTVDGETSITVGHKNLRVMWAFDKPHPTRGFFFRSTIDAWNQRHGQVHLVGLGLVAVLKGDMAGAASVLKEVLRANRATGDSGGVSTTTEFLAWAAMDAGDDLRAARLLGFSQGMAEPVVAHLFAWQILQSWHDARLAALRDRLGEEVLQAELSRGRAMPVADGIAYALEERSAPPPAAPEHEKLPLTRREYEVAQLLAQGLSNRDIASQFVISPRTVEGHVEHILAKLGFTSRAQVIALFAARASQQQRNEAG
jgi:DNA-binding CsgD family transcriptional regulator